MIPSFVLGQRNGDKIYSLSLSFSLSLSLPSMDSNQGREEAPSGPASHLEREFWTNESIAVLLDEYGKVFAKSGRGHVKSKDWERIAEEVNRGRGRKRTPEQCKTKIEGLKKYYRKERLKAAAVPSAPSDPHPWIFFDKLDRIMLTAATSTPTPAPAPTLPLTTEGLLVDPLSLPLPPLLNNRPDKKAPAVGSSLGFQQRLFERMGLNQTEYQARTAECGFENRVDEPRKKLKADTSSPLPPKQASNPSNPSSSSSLRGRAGKKRDYSSELGRDIKEGLGGFAAVIKKIEQRKAELAESIQRQRLEQDRRLAEMEAERARLIMGSHAELAKLIGRRGGPKRRDDDGENALRGHKGDRFGGKEGGKEGEGEGEGEGGGVEGMEHIKGRIAL